MKVLPKFFQVPLKFPSNFTPIAMSRDVIPPQRFLMAVQQQLADRDPDQVGVTKLSRAMFATIFESEKDLVPLNKPERLRAIALAAGLDSSIVDEALQQMNSDPVKEGLRRNIMDATQAGVFGTPSFVVQQDQDSYLVFGSDRIEILAYLLGEKYSGPVPSKE